MIKLYRGDCLDIMPTLPDNSIDLIVVDPPYTMTSRGKSCRPNLYKNNLNKCLFDAKDITPDLWIPHTFRLLKDGHIYVFTNTISINTFMNTLKNEKFKLHNILTMIKDTRMPSRWYYKETELILFYRKGKAKPINNMSCKDHIKVVMPKQKIDKVHLTQKPLSIITTFVENSSNENEFVLDPFMGSGTTGVACAKLGRNFIGIERDKKSFDIAVKRITEAGGRGIEIYE